MAASMGKSVQPKGPPSCPRLKLREAVSLYFTTLALFLVILVVALQGTDPPETRFPYKVPLDPQGLLELSWDVSYRRAEVSFQVALKELRPGLLLGMSDRGGFANADLAVFWSNGSHSFFADAWSDRGGQLHMDPHQNYQLLGARKVAQGLSLVFKRPFDTCDPRDYLIEGGTVHLVYGILEKPIQSLKAVNFSTLPYKGLQRVQLLKPQITAPPLPADLKSMEVKSPHVEIPGQETTYWCYIQELPEDFAKHHIVMVGLPASAGYGRHIRKQANYLETQATLPGDWVTAQLGCAEDAPQYEPVITAGNEALVHHIEVFQCAAQFPTIPHFNGPCDSKMKPERLNYCRHVLAAWAMGAQAFYYPEEAGLAFGGPGSSKYLRLEVHYHNPLELKGRRDSSGIRLYYTASLRPYNAGIMELGLVYTPVMAIPPGQGQFSLTGYCTDKCTQLALPQAGIHIFASQLHTHLSGQSVMTMLSREGREQEIVNADRHYSPHFQEIRMLKNVVSVFPGDVLRTTCTYNTEDRKQVTVGGFGIMDEMCVNYIHYYPQTELELCKSAIDAGYLHRYFQFVNRFDDEAVCTCPGASVTQQFSSVPWNPFNTQVLTSLYDFAPISMHCNKSSAVRFPGEWEKQPLPRIMEPLSEPVSPCEPSRDPPLTSPTLVKFQKTGLH